jgi:hypothetical protein
MSTSFTATERTVANAALLSHPQTEAVPPRGDRLVEPRIVAITNLPVELLARVTRCMIPDSPFLARPSGSVPHFRIAPAMNGLRNWAQTCKPLYAMVATLRKDNDHFPFAQLAGRAEYEFRRRSEQARQASIERYGVDPEYWEDESLVLRLYASDVEGLIGCKKDLRECADDARTIWIRLGPDAIDASVDLLGGDFAGCTAMRELSLSTEGTLPLALISAFVKDQPSLKLLRLEGRALPAGLFDCLVAAPAFRQIESLVLEITCITPEDFDAMAQAAPYLRRLRFLSVYGAMLSKECCQVLAAALPDFVLLESLQLGRKKGGIDAAGALALVAAARTGGRVTRLGLHNIEDKAAISPVLEALQQYAGLKELAMTGPLDEACAIQLWTFLSGDASCLRALDLENCGLDEQQIKNLAEAMKSSGHLQELRLARQQFTNKGARKLARAIRASTSLLRLSLDDCNMDATTQARSLGAGVARNKSLLELTLLIPGAGKRYADSRASNIAELFEDVARHNSTLLHFGVSSHVVDGWSHGYWAMKQNRMI